MATPPPPSGVRRHSAATGADVQQQFNWSENPFSTASPAASMSTPTSTAGMHECVGVGGGGGVRVLWDLYALWVLRYPS